MIPALHGCRYFLQRRFHHPVSRRLADDIQHLQNRNPAPDQLRKGPRKAGHTNLVDQRAEHRQLKLQPVPESAPVPGPEKTAETEPSGGHGSQEENPLGADKVAQIDQELGWGGKFCPKIGEDRREGGDHLYNQKRGDAEGDQHHDHWVGHRRFYLFSEPRRGLKKCGEAIEDFGQQPPGFACFDHGDVESGKMAGLFAKRLVKRVALLEQGHQVAGNPPKRPLFAGVGLFVESGEGRDEGEAGGHHGCQLSREQNQVRFRDPALGGPQAARAALLDAEHQQTSGHERLDGVVLVEGLLNPGNCFSCGVTGFVGECVHGARCSKGQAIVEQDICLPGLEMLGHFGLELLLKRLAKGIGVGEGRGLHQTL